MKNKKSKSKSVVVSMSTDDDDQSFESSASAISTLTQHHRHQQQELVFVEENTINNNDNDDDQEEWFRSVRAVEAILNYRFKDRSLLEAALTHSSYPDSPSYQRLEFIGDAAIGSVLANFVFIAYPDLDPGQLSLLRAANISTEKLARVAVKHNLFSFVRHCAQALATKVLEFSIEIKKEGDEILPYGGAIKAPKVLADIVESIVAAVLVDCGFDYKLLWEYINHLLEPIVTLENLQQQPVTMLYELCQKEGKSIKINHSRDGTKDIAKVLVNGKVLGSATSENKEISKLTAAKRALENMCVLQSSDILDEGEEIHEAKQKLIELCDKKRWSKPSYSVESQEGPSHDKRFTCAVKIETLDGTLLTTGNVKQKVKVAEKSAALAMLQGLKDPKYGIGFS